MKTYNKFLFMCILMCYASLSASHDHKTRDLSDKIDQWHNDFKRVGQENLTNIKDETYDSIFNVFLETVSNVQFRVRQIQTRTARDESTRTRCIDKAKALEDIIATRLITSNDEPTQKTGNDKLLNKKGSNKSPIIASNSKPTHKAEGDKSLSKTRKKNFPNKR